MYQTTPTLQRCTIQRRNGEFCDMPAAEDMPFPICGHHAVKLFARLSTMTAEAREDLAPRSHRAPTRGVGRRLQNESIKALVAGRSTVYAVRFPDGIVKIGCSSKLQNRLSAYWSQGAELVGFRFGEYADEQEIHRSLKPHVARGREYYHPATEVLAAVNSMRDEFNLPHIAA